MNILTVENVHHSYFTPKHATTALKNISFTIKKGEFISLIGPSGCGKTTLLSILAGLITPTEGRVIMNGKELQEVDASTGYMLQQDYLFPWKTIKENILIGLQLTNRLNKEAEHKALRLLNKIGLNNVEDKFPNQLSGGMRQRAALVRTLAVNPQILLLDEPFSALDYQTKLKLENLVFETLKSFGKTAVLVTHDIGEAISMSDRIFLFSTNPGELHKVFDVPNELRILTPFQVRSHEAYSTLFQNIWKELNEIENSRSNKYKV